MAAVKKKQMMYNVILEPAEDGTYTVYVPALPGCVSHKGIRKRKH